MTTSKAIELFLEVYFGINQRSSKTRSGYEVDLKQLMNFVGADSMLSSIEPAKLEAWAAQLQARPYGIASIRRKLASVRVFFGYWGRRVR